MRIEANQTYVARCGGPDRTEAPRVQRENGPCTAPAPEPEAPPASAPAAPAAPESAPAPAHSCERARALLERLENGHGHRARHRSNSCGERSARAAARENLGTLADATGDAVEGFITSLALDEASAGTARELLGDFRAALKTIVRDRRAGPLDERLRAAFDQFAGSLRQAIAPAPPPAPAPSDIPSPEAPAPDAPVEQPPVIAQPADTTEVPAPAPAPAPPAPTDPADPTPAPAPEPGPGVLPSLDDAMTTLSDAFASALSAFLDTIRQSSRPPEHSGARGHKGCAHRRFMAAYHSLCERPAPAVDQAA